MANKKTSKDKVGKSGNKNNQNVQNIDTGSVDLNDKQKENEEVEFSQSLESENEVENLTFSKNLLLNIKDELFQYLGNVEKEVAELKEVIKTENNYYRVALEREKTARTEEKRSLIEKIESLKNGLENNRIEKNELLKINNNLNSEIEFLKSKKESGVLVEPNRPKLGTQPERTRVPQRSGTPENQPVTILYGDSNTELIDRIRLSKTLKQRVEKSKASLIQNIDTDIQMENVKNIIIHTGINDIRELNSEKEINEKVKELKEKVKELMEKHEGANIIISELMPVENKELEKKRKMYNRRIEIMVERFESKVKCVDNNFLINKSGYVINKFYRKNEAEKLHLNIFGIALLVKNLLRNCKGYVEPNKQLYIEPNYHHDYHYGNFHTGNGNYDNRTGYNRYDRIW